MEVINYDVVKGGDSFHVIVHQINCLTVKAHGLSEKLFSKYPYSDVYSKRRQEGNKNLAVDKDRGTPGEITVSWEKDKPVIVGLLAQYDFSTVNYRYRRGIIQETTKMRESGFGSVWINWRSFYL